MTKKELIRKVAKQTGYTKAECSIILDAILHTAADELAEGGELLLTGFGSLRVKERPPRKGIHPRTGDAIEIPQGRTIVFKAGTPLQSRLEPPSDKSPKTSE